METGRRDGGIVTTYDWEAAWNKPERKFDDFFTKPESSAEIIPPATVNGTSAYGAKALQEELHILGNTGPNSHKRNDQLNISAFALAQLVAAGHLPDQTTRQELYRTGVAIGLTPTETRDTIRSAFSAGLQQPREVPELPAPHTNITEVPETTIMGDKPNSSEPSEQRSYIDLLADDEYRKLKAREIAKQRLIQESAVGITLPDFYQLDEFLAQPDTETPYLVNEIWPKGGHILIVAQQKAGKTTLRNNLAKSLCDGYDFLNRFQVHKPEGRIVILDLELPENMLRRWMRDCGIHNQQQLVVVPMRGKAASLNIGLPEVRAKWAQKLEAWDASCVILDCLRPVLDALNMSEDKDASKFLGHFDALLVEAGVPDAAVIHHAGHGSDRARGDSGILGWSDATWGLSLEDPQNQASPRYFKAYGRIERDVPDAKLDYDPLTRKLAWVGGTKTDAKAKAAMPHVVTFLRANPPTEQNPAPSQTAIQKALKTDLDIGYPVTKQAIALLEREGSLLVSEGKSGTRSAHSLTELADENYPPPASTDLTDQPISDRLGTASNRSDRGPIHRLTATSSGIGNRSADDELNGL
jgi:hypothetical protein